MPAVESLPNNLRRIAVLVASVDPATARQLLLQLPTDIAKQVRGALQNLGPIDPFERQRIIAEFQSTAARQARQAQASQMTATHAASAPAAGTVPAPTSPQPASYPAAVNNPAISGSAPTSTLNTSAGVQYGTASATGFQQSNAGYPGESGNSPIQRLDPSNLQFEPHLANTAAHSETRVAWKRMDARALSRLLAGERPTVVAVVLSQLAPETGVTLLQQLPMPVQREVLQCIVHLQDIDAEAMQAIDEHLAERIKDYEHQVNSEAESTRRISSLIAVAPPALQQTWLQMLRDANAEAGEESTASLQTVATAAAQTAEATVQASGAASVFAESQGAGSGVTHSPSIESTAHSSGDEARRHAGAARTAASASVHEQLSGTVAVRGDSTSAVDESADPNILPFPGSQSPAPMNNADRSLLQIEFERLLQLAPPQLAQVLSTADSHTVLLALAGASPAFMKRFYMLLTKQDAKILAARLSKIGPLKLRDIDEAQQRLVELAAKITASSNHRSRSMRTAA